MTFRSIWFNPFRVIPTNYIKIDLTQLEHIPYQGAGNTGNAYRKSFADTHFADSIWFTYKWMFTRTMPRKCCVRLSVSGFWIWYKLSNAITMFHARLVRLQQRPPTLTVARFHACAMIILCHFLWIRAFCPEIHGSYYGRYRLESS